MQSYLNIMNRCSLMCKYAQTISRNVEIILCKHLIHIFCVTVIRSFKFMIEIQVFYANTDSNLFCSCLSGIMVMLSVYLKL